MDVRLKKILFVLILFASVPACTWFGGTTSITIGCDVDELIDAINTGNASSDDYIINLAADCDYTLFTPDNTSGGLGDNGLPAITNWFKFYGNNATIQRSLGNPIGTSPEFRIFFVTDTGRLSLENITISYGGGDRGGAVYNDGGVVTARDTFFNSNRVSWGGGAIYNRGVVSIYDTTIQDNSAEVRGGGIYSQGSLFISNTTITANTVLTDVDGGGGVYNQGELIIADSTISDNFSASQGGGVSVYYSTLTITGSTFQGNQASTRGGGLSTAFSTTTISGDSLFDGNTAQISGGGIYNGQDSVMTLEGSTVSNNQALVAVEGFGGGGIYNSGSYGTMTISTTTISGNTSGYYGGGVATNGVMLITQSTINNNTALEQGGGIWGYNLTMINSTVSGNHSGSPGGGVYALSNTAIISSTIVHNSTDSSIGGGLRSVPNNMIKNSIIALNSPADCSTISLLNDVGINLSDSSCIFSSQYNIHADPLIGPLADNGGPTFTHALLPGSPAIDAAVFCAGTPGDPVMHPVIFDQRFASRPGGPECDIGAYEVSTIFVSPPPPPPPPMISMTPTSPVYWCESILGITILEGGMMRIQLSTPGLPAGTYNATVGRYDFTCQTYDEYPDRLFCDGPKGEGGTLTTLTIFDPLGILICEETFSIPAREVPDELEDKGCWWGTPQTAPVCVYPCPNDDNSGGPCDP